jgi:hypothetical protein
MLCSEFDRAGACRAKPERGAASEMSPKPGAAPPPGSHRVKAMGTTDDGGEGGLHNSFGALLVGRRSDAGDTVARGTCHPSLASHTDISDRHITVVSRSMVGGLEVDLVLRLRRLRSVAGLVASRKRISDRQRHHPQAEDIFLTRRAWRGHRNCVNQLHVQQSTEELVACRSSLAGTYSSDDRRSLDQLLQKRVPDHQPASLIATLLLSLGIWAGIWGAITSWASVVLR